MNEYTVLKNSRKIAILGVLIFGITSLLTKDISYLVGFGLGYLISTLTFLAIIQSSTTMLSLRGGAVPIVMLLFIVKLSLYALGFLLAFKIPRVFHIVSVVVGYFVIKITIYLTTYQNKGGEQSE